MVIGLTSRGLPAGDRRAPAFLVIRRRPSSRILAGVIGPVLLACPAERYQRPPLPAPRYEVAPVSPWDAGVSDPSALDPELEPALLPDGGPSKNPELGIVERSVIERSVIEPSVVERGHTKPRAAGEGSPEK